uniref:Fucose kinase n=1 Tax=Fundulus heteroclitus TaxID=8078 RepID=A0A3Q2PSS2_FUNHE
MSQNGGFPWTVVVLTCQHKDSVYAFQRELELRQQRGTLPGDALLLTVRDRQEPLGSGGATLNALLVAAEHLSNRAGHTVVTADVLDEAHILILHTGRDFPWSSCSRAFCWLPEEKPGQKVQAPVCVLDLLLDRLSSPPGVWVCSTDMILTVPTDFALSWSGFSGVRVLAVPGDVSYAADHGVYLADSQGRVRDIIYRGSREQIQRALMPDGKVPLVSGPVFFCRSVSEKLLQTHVSPPLDGCTYLGLDSGAPPLQVPSPDQITSVMASAGTTCYSVSSGVPQGPLDVPSGCLLSGLDISASACIRRLALSNDIIIQGHRIELGELKLNVFGLQPANKHRKQPHSCVGFPLSNQPPIFLLRPEELWVRGEQCSLLEARLFPVLHPRGGAVGLEGGVGWLLGGPGCLQRWREAWRVSLREVLSLTHQEAELQWREELLFLVGRRRVTDALRSRTDVCLLPCFRAAVQGGQQGALLETLDCRAEPGEQLGVSARCLSCIADVLVCMAQGKGGLRSGPAANEAWSSAYFLLEEGSLKEGVSALAAQRQHWLSRPDLLVRAARHYEGAGQVLLRQAVMSSQRFISIGQGEAPPIGEWQEVECPARLDLAGGWSDTPPIAFEHGGSVTNIAVKVDGKRPIGARARRIVKPHLLLVSHSGGRGGASMETVCDTLDDLRDYCQPHAPGALLKAVCVCSGLVSLSSPRPLEHQLMQSWGSGVELHSWSELPTGSGLGEIYGNVIQPSCREKRFVKGILCNRGKPLVGTILLQDHSICFVQDVVRSWYSRLPSMVLNAQQLVSNSEECARACLDGELPAATPTQLGRCLDRSWQQKKLMAPGCEPASVRTMMEALRPLVLGQSLAGAGGGGFLYLVTRDPRQQQAVLQVLRDTPGLGDFSVHSVELDMEGIAVRSASSN